MECANKGMCIHVQNYVEWLEKENKRLLDNNVNLSCEIVDLGRRVAFFEQAEKETANGPS